MRTVVYLCFEEFMTSEQGDTRPVVRTRFRDSVSRQECSKSRTEFVSMLKPTDFSGRRKRMILRCGADIQHFPKIWPFAVGREECIIDTLAEVVCHYFTVPTLFISNSFSFCLCFSHSNWRETSATNSDVLTRAQLCDSPSRFCYALFSRCWCRFLAVLHFHFYRNSNKLTKTVRCFEFKNVIIFLNSQLLSHWALYRLLWKYLRNGLNEACSALANQTNLGPQRRRPSFFIPLLHHSTRIRALI